MNVEVIGGGALGLLYGARLAAARYNVRIWTRTVEQAELLSSQGIAFSDKYGTRTVRVEALPARHTSAAEIADGAAAVLLAVKQMAIDAGLLALLQRLADAGIPVICLQNGIGHMEKLREALPAIPFAASVTTEGAFRSGPCAVRHTGEGTLWMETVRAERPGELRGRRPTAEETQKMLLSAMDKAGIPVFMSNEINTHIYRKLLVNAIINPMTALFGVTNGELPLDPIRKSLMASLCRETTVVLTAAGMRPDEDSMSTILAVCEKTASNHSSMLTDIRAGKPTEIDWINGGIVRLAHGLGLEAPLNEAMLTVIKSLS
jgi:2-dehydropantoate 2-reductase